MNAVMRYVLIIVMVGLMLGGGALLIDVEVDSQENVQPFIEPLLDLNNTDGKTLNTIGISHITFAPEGVYITAVDWPLLTPQYFIMDAGWGYKIQHDWTVSWAANTYGEGEIELSVYVRPPETEEFELWDTNTVYVADEGEALWQDVVESILYFDDIGYHDIVMEINILVNVGEDAVEKHYSVESQVVVLPPADDIIFDINAFVPLFGELEANGLLMDWRALHGGPCDLPVPEEDNLDDLIAEICTAYAEDDLGRLVQLLNAAQLQTDAHWFKAIVQDQLGMIMAITEQWVFAHGYFSQAFENWLLDGSPLETSISLHNLAIAQAVTEQHDASAISLQQVELMREQLGDEIGGLLTWTQIAVFSDDLDSVDELTVWMEEWDMPQADALSVWREQAQQDS